MRLRRQQLAALFVIRTLTVAILGLVIIALLAEAVASAREGSARRARVVINATPSLGAMHPDWVRTSKTVGLTGCKAAGPVALGPTSLSSSFEGQDSELPAPLILSEGITLLRDALDRLQQNKRDRIERDEAF